MLGFRGSLAELAELEINIHYGVNYLSKAWRLAGGDLCQALMKDPRRSWRGGHDPAFADLLQPGPQPVRRHKFAFASPGAVAAIEPVAPVAKPAAVTPRAEVKSKTPIRPKDVYASLRQGTAAASRAYWAAHEARIKTIKAQIESPMETGRVTLTAIVGWAHHSG